MTDQLILFDGICNLCKGTVRFIIRRDRTKKFSFAAMQSQAGQEILKQAGVSAANQSTVVYVKQGRFYFRSAAVLEILRDLGCCRFLLFVLIITPPFIRDVVYDIVAKTRYRLFGKQDSCMIPAPEIKDRFLD